MFTYTYEYKVFPVKGTTLFRVDKIQFRINTRARGKDREPVPVKKSTVLNRVSKEVADDFVFKKERQ